MNVRTASRLWYLVTAVVVGVAFAIQFWLLFTGGADANSGESGSGIPLPTRFVRLFSFFTIDSNVLVLVVSILLAIRPERDGRLWRALHLTTLLSIAVTGTVFGFILAPGLQLREGAVVATTLFHTVSPALFALGWLLFGPRRRWTWRILPLAFALPILWLVTTFVRGALVDWYPYPFLDAGALGIGPALLGAALVLVYALLLAGIVLAVDRWVPAVTSRSGAASASAVHSRAVRGPRTRS